MHILIVHVLLPMYNPFTWTEDDINTKLNTGNYFGDVYWKYLTHVDEQNILFLEQIYMLHTQNI